MKYIIVASFILINIISSGYTVHSLEKIYTYLTNNSRDSTSTKDDGSFSIAIIPDTQYYISGYRNGTYDMFTAQVKWITDHASAENTQYVVHLGNMTDFGDSIPSGWTLGAEAMYALEKPREGFPHGIPYGVAVGNHDQFAPGHIYGRPFSCMTIGYNKYFGIDHFSPKSYENGGYYGGHYGADNDCHFDLFDVEGQGYIVVYIEYDNNKEYEDKKGLMTQWASEVLAKHADRKAIIVSHSILKPGPNPSYNEPFAEFSPQGQRIYDVVKHHKNVFLMLCGHEGLHGEGYREDVFQGNTIRTYLSNYQMRPLKSSPSTGNGGGGLMRLMKFFPNKNYMEVSTFTPYKDPIEFENDEDSKFIRPMF